MTRAVVRQLEDGSLVLDDPDALAVFEAVNRANADAHLAALLEVNVARVKYFERRVAELGRAWSDTIIVVLNVDDAFGGALADALMPGHDWQPFRDRGEVPIARGLAEREGIQGLLDSAFPDVGRQLAAIRELAVLVVAERAVGVFAVRSAQS